MLIGYSGGTSRFRTLIAAELGEPDDIIQRDYVTRVFQQQGL